MKQTSQCYRSYQISLLSVALIIILTGCGLFDSDEGIDKDKNELAKELDGLFVTYWKGAKISIRSLPVTKISITIDFKKIKESQTKRLNLGTHLSRIYDWENFINEVKEERKPLAASEFVAFAKEIYTLAKTIKDMDEDQYPTFIEVISNSRAALNKTPLEVSDNWNNSIEHWVFALVCESKAGLGSWKNYELERVNPHDLETTDLRTLAFLHKGVNYLRNEWFYLAEEAFTKNLIELEKNNITLHDKTKEFLARIPISAPSPEEQFRLQLSGVTYLIRGFTRTQMKKSKYDEKAVMDVEQAVEYLKKSGMDNEIVWIAESFVYIKRKDAEKAVVSIRKLENSPLFNGKDKKLLAEAKQMITDRDADCSLNVLTDKVLMCKLGINYALSHLAEIEWMKVLEETEEGRRLLARFAELKTTYEKAKKYMKFDNLKEKGKSLYNELTSSDESISQ